MGQAIARRKDSHCIERHRLSRWQFANGVPRPRHLVPHTNFANTTSLSLTEEAQKNTRVPIGESAGARGDASGVILFGTKPRTTLQAARLMVRHGGKSDLQTGNRHRQFLFLSFANE